MNKKFYQLCCMFSFVMVTQPLLSQNVADSVVIKDEWSSETSKEKTNEIQVSQFNNNSEGSGQVDIVSKPARVELTVLGRNKYNRSKEKKSRNYYRRYFSGHTSGIFVGLTNYLQNDNIYGSNDEFMALDWSRSRTVIFNPIQGDVSFTRRGFFGMVLGVGLEYQRLYFSNKQYSIQEGPNGIIIPLAIDPSFDVRRSTLKHLYLTASASLEIQVKEFFLSVGAIGGVRMLSQTKVVYDYEGEKHKQIENEDFSILPFKVDGALKVGYNGVTIFCNYTLTRMFEKGKGLDLQPLTIGFGYAFEF